MIVAAAFAIGTATLGAQGGVTPADVRVVVTVTKDSAPLVGVLLKSGAKSTRTDATGKGTLQLPAGERWIVASRLGFAPDSIRLLLATDTTVTISLVAATEVEGVIVSATRSERRIEDDPLRVELLAQEEVEEKLRMTPGDITMMLNETSGLRVQTTSPSLGGASVRIQGLRGRYTQILADGLPLYGGQTGGLGLLQIPPMDLGGVEIIKGVASALYGGSALGGVINLVSRRPAPADGPVRDLLVNQTTLGGTDVVGFGAGNRGDLGYTLLAGAHRQTAVDRDHDGWIDIPGYSRLVVRPRGFWSHPAGHSAMVTAGTTLEQRDGGTLDGHTAPDGSPHPERLRTRRFDGGGVARWLVRGGDAIVSVRGSAAAQRHTHTFGPIEERDRHLTWFGESAVTLPHRSGLWVFGVAVEQERYTSAEVPEFDFTFTAPSLFAQNTVDLGARLAVTTSARLDAHDEYGSQLSPRLSALLRLAPEWSVRASAGAGYFAPTPFTEETEVTGLTPVRPARSLRAERARSGSVDLAGNIGATELNVTLFGSRIDHPVAARDGFTAVPRIDLVNVDGATRTVGGEVLARWVEEPFHVTASYTRVRSTEIDPESGARRVVPLTPAHQAGLVAAWEAEDRARAGVELYYTGRQELDRNPYRFTSKPYLHIGVLVERRFGRASVFVNAENLLDYRQTHYDRLVMPGRGLGGRWTTDVWAPLDGRVANVGVRLRRD